ncbi:MAG: SH3 domain-containing protein [Chloroflexota bacterium]
MRSFNVLLGLCVCVLMGCAPAPPVHSITPTPLFVTATLPATLAPSLTAAPGTATASATPTPLSGTTTTQLNIRAEPLSSSTVLGIIGASTTLQILGRDPGGNWYQIVYAGGDEGIGWVASEFVTVLDENAVPVVGGSSSEPTASVREQINVRSGPGTNFDALGTLNPRDVVTLAGKDSLGSWLQIKFAAGPDGKGWVAASFLEAAEVDGLPIVAESGEVVGTSTPTGVPPVPTPTVVAAREDGDSADAPAADVKFSPSGAGSVFFASDVSAPEGDAADWIRFTPYFATVTIDLACRGNGQLTAVLLQGGEIVPEGRGLICGQAARLTLTGGKSYTLRLQIAASSSQLAHVQYTISIYGAPSR